MFLQSPTDQELQEYVLKRGEILYKNALIGKDKSLLHVGNYIETGFEQLSKKPFESMKEIYSSNLAFDFFDEAAKSSYPNTLGKEVQELEGYKRNKFRHVQLDTRLKREIQERWNNEFETFG